MKMRPSAARLSTSNELGRARRSLDTLLGWSASAPLVLGAAATWFAPPMLGRPARLMAIVWAGCLLAFFAGVRRGLTFSEAGGGRAAELTTMLGLFALGVTTILFVSPLLGAVGLAAVGLLDTVAARRGETPAYFAALRPPQMAVCVVGLLLAGLR